MTDNYTIEDFAEYEQIFKSKGESIGSLVENLNCIISTNNEVCDMYICMNYFSKYKKLNNIDYRNDFFVTEQFYEKYLFIVWMFETIPFTYNFVYYMSNTPEYQSMLKEDEISITSREDFMRRFESNTDKFIRLYNFINNDGDICIPIHNYDTIPTDKIILNRNPDILYINKIKFVNDFMCLIFDSPFTIYNCVYKSFKKVLNKYNYNNLYPNNEYKMMIIEIIDLKKRYKSYFKSKLYGNLDFINFLYNKYTHIVEIKELTDYLEEIIKKHHFNKKIKY